MKKKLKTIWNKIRQSLKPMPVYFALLLLLSVWSVWRMLSVFSGPADDNRVAPPSVTREIATGELARMLKTDSDRLFKTGWPGIDSALYVNTKTATLYFQRAPKENPVGIAYEGRSPLIKSPKPAMRQLFDSLVMAQWQINGYSPATAGNTRLSADSILRIATYIGANPKYVRQIIDAGNTDLRTILFSMLYNTVLGGTEGHIVTLIEHGKMRSIDQKNYTVDIVDRTRLAAALQTMQKGSKSEELIFVDRLYDSLHHAENGEPAAQDDPANRQKQNAGRPLQDMLDATFGKGAIRLSKTLPLPFVYVNFKEDGLSVGDTMVHYNTKTLEAKDEHLAQTILENKFNIKGPTNTEMDPAMLRTIAGNAGFGFDSMDIKNGKGNVQILFKTLMTYLLARPSVYYIADGKLTEYGTSSPDPSYGKFDTTTLRAGLQQLITTDTGGNDMVIIHKSDDIPLLPMFTIVLLLLTSGVLFIRVSRQNRKIAALEGKEPGTAVSDKNAELAGDDKKDKILSLEEKSEKTAPAEETVVAKRQNAEIKSEKTDPLTEIFIKAGHNKSVNESIGFLLSKYDSSPTGKNSGENLAEHFNTLCKTKSNYDKIRTLLTDPDAGDPSDYLEKNIRILLSETDLQGMANFAILFRTPDGKKISDASAILDEYRRLQDCLSTFYARYDRLSGRDIKLLERTAIICWTADLANELNRLRRAAAPLIDIDRMKLDQLELIFGRYFFGLASQADKTETDFEDKLQDGYGRIKAYNSGPGQDIASLAVDEGSIIRYIDGLRGLMAKIKSYDKTVIFFDRLYKYFVKDFINRLDNLGFSRADLDPADRAWLFGQVFNIAFHAADYTEHFVKGDKEYYHPNVQLLMNDLDLKKSELKVFVEDDMNGSSTGSNSVAKALRFAGVRQVHFLVNQYYIKPE